MNSMTVSVNNRLYKSMAGGCKNGSKTDSTQLGEFAPKFAELNDDVLFGEVWAGEETGLQN